MTRVASTNLRHGEAPAERGAAPAATALPDSLMAFCRAPQQFLLDMASTGPAARFRMGEETFLVLSDPASVHAVMGGRLDDFEKGAMIEIPRPSWRDGIISVDGEGWAEQHAMIAPLFARRRIRELEPLVAERVARLTGTWAALPAGEPVDILAAASRLTFDIVATGMLGVADPAVADDLFETLVSLDRAELVRLNYLAKRVGADIQGTFGRSAYAQALDRLNRLTAAVADARLARAAPSDDFLGALMRTEAFAAFPPERRRAFLADQVASMLAAGYVTSGESIFWTMYLLAKHPAAQARARAEVLAETTAASGDAPMDAPPFLSAVFNEAHRLYPPVWFLGRVPRRHVRVGDMEIEPGVRVVCSPYVLHRLPALWPDADRFRPERFLPGASPAPAPRAHIPFGTGMRACLGRGLAQMEMAAAAGMILARFEVELASDPPIDLAATFSMHPREPVLFRLKPLP